MTRKKDRSRRPRGDDPVGPRLAPELFSELNATFYQDDPSDYLLTKVEALTLMLAPDGALAPAYASDRCIGVLRLGGMPVPSKESRDRYVRAECVLALHHACELLLRLFFAHSERPECPWLGMAASVNFAEFKEKANAALRNGFDCDAVGLVFLGGTDPRDAAIHVKDDEFQDAAQAVQLLLAFAAQTVLSESFLYNAAKHGLTVVQTDDETRTAFHQDGSELVELHAGPQFAYLHKPQFPGAPRNKGLPEWHMSLTNTLPDQDIGASLLIQRAVSSLWAVARRRYTGQRGQVHIIPTAVVRDVVSGAVLNAGQSVRTHTLELAKKDTAGKFLGVSIRMSGPRLPDQDTWEPGASASAPTSRCVDLPVRQRDQQIVSATTRRLLPISPAWSSRV